MTGTPIDLTNNWNFEQGALDGSNMWGIAQAYYTLDSNGNLVAPSVGPPSPKVA